MNRLFLFFVFIIGVVGAMFAQTAISFGPGSNGQTIRTCSGFLIDSGGQGGSGYSNNENTTITICPNNVDDIIVIHFTSFNLSNTNDSGDPQRPNVDYMDVYDGTTVDPARHMGNYSGTQLFNVIIQPSEVNESGCITLRFRSNTVGTGSFGAAVTCSTPCVNPVSQAIIVGAPVRPDSIAICVGDAVSFRDNGSFAQPGFNIVSYTWDFMDGSTATGQNVSHVFTQPGLYQVNLRVQDSNLDNVCLNNNVNQLRVYVATFPDFSALPSEFDMCIGDSRTITIDPNQIPVEWRGFPGSTLVEDGCITDTQLGVVQQVPLTQTGFAAGTTIQSASDIVSICLDMEHTFIGDLLISLTCPNGQTVILHQQGGSGTNLGQPVTSPAVNCDNPATQGIPGNYCWTNSATITWAQSSTGNGTVVAGGLVEGDYAPVNSLAGFVGCPTNGVWTLNITDLWAADDGTVFGFQLNLNPDFYPDDIAFTPSVGVGADSSRFTPPSGDLNASISNDGDGITIRPTASGIFTVDYAVINNFGCESTHTITVTVPELVDVNAGNDTIICLGNSVTMRPIVTSGNPCTYTLRLRDTANDGWHGNNLVLSNALTGNGTFTITSGGVFNTTFTANPSSPFNIRFNVGGNFVYECWYQILNEDGVVLFESNGNLTNHNRSHTLSCVPTQDYVWTPSNLFANPNIANAVMNTPPLGVHNLSLEVRPQGNAACESSFGTRTVTVIEPPFAGNDGEVLLCTSSAPVDLFQYLGGQNIVTGGVWRNQNNQIVQMPFDPATMAQGNYRYTVGQGTCSDFAIVRVQLFNTTINTFDLTDVTCNSADNGTLGVSGIGFDYYILTGGNSQGGQVPITSPFFVDGLAPGDYTIAIHSNDGCSTTRDFVITEPDPLVITSISNDTLICGASDAILVATGAGGSSDYTFTWVNEATDQVVGVGSTITVTPPNGTTRYCVVLSEGCESPVDRVCMNVTTEEFINPVIIPNKIDGCEPLEVAFENESVGSILTTTVFFGDGNSQIIEGNLPFINVYQNDGMYSMRVQIVSELGCISEMVYENLIIAHAMPIANFNYSPNPVNMFNTDVMFTDLSAGDIETYRWSFEQGVPSYSIQKSPKSKFPDGEEGNYTVQLIVTTPFGCVDTVSREVIVVNDVILYAPNTFTPDGDEFNQVFRTHIIGIDQYSYQMQVFNRWGEMVFESFDASIGWDGTYNGKIVQDGAYNWVIRARDLYTDNKYEFTGSVTIIR